MRGPVYSVAFAPDGRHVATVNANGTVYVLRLAAAALPLAGCGGPRDKQRPPPQVGYVVVAPSAVPLPVSLGGRTVAYESSEVRPQIGGVHRAVIEALRYASALAKDVRAVYVNVNPESLVQLKKDWPVWGSHVKLVVLQSPYRSMTEPLLDYIDRMEKEHPDDYITVVLPEFVVKHWWHHLLHNQSALTLKAALLFRPRVVTTSVPFHLTQ